MPVVSAGLLLWRRAPDGIEVPPGGIEVFVAHLGGPFWARKHEGAWSIPPRRVRSRDRGRVGCREARVPRGDRRARTLGGRARDIRPPDTSPRSTWASSGTDRASACAYSPSRHPASRSRPSRAIRSSSSGRRVRGDGSRTPPRSTMRNGSRSTTPPAPVDGPAPGARCARLPHSGSVRVNLMFGTLPPPKRFRRCGGS